MSKYQKYSKLSTVKFKRIVYYFSHDLTATTTAKLTSVSTRTVNKIYQYIRNNIAEYKIKNKCKITDLSKQEYYIGLKQGSKKSTSNQSMIFGIFILNNSIKTLVLDGDILEKVFNVFAINSKILTVKNGKNITKNTKNYYGIVDLDYKNIFENNNISHKVKEKSIKSFLGYARSRLMKLKGVTNKAFNLHLYETEFRFNKSEDEVYALLIKMLKKNSL